MDKFTENSKKISKIHLQRLLINLFFLLTFIVIILLNILSYYQVSKFAIAGQYVTQTHQIIQATNNALINMLEIESLTKSYLIEDNKTFTQALNQKTDNFYYNLNLAKKLLISRNRQQKLVTLENLFKQNIQLIRQSILFKKNNKVETTRLSLIHQSENLSKKIKIALLEINTETFGLLKERNENALNHLNQLNIFIIVTSIITVLIFLISFLAINQQLSRQQSANNKLKLAYEELKEHDRGMSSLNEMDTLLQTCTTIEEALQLITAYCKKLLPLVSGIIYLSDTSNKHFTASATWNEPQTQEKVFYPDQCWALRQKKIHLFLNKKENIPCSHYARKKLPQISFCIPLLAQNDLIGLLYIEIQKMDSTEEEKIHLALENYQLIMNNMATLIALSIANIRLKDNLRTQSLRDPLTKLYNRAYLNEFLVLEINRAERDNTKLAIVMLDIDHFKSINDTLGHQEGDLILQTIGKVLLKQVRKSDIACRYGGEEFLLMLYDTTLNDATKRVKEIKQSISEIKFHSCEGLVKSITASFGIAIYPDHSRRIHALIKSADQALYLSKQRGRNRITVYELSSNETSDGEG